MLFQSKDLVRIQKLVNFLNKLAVVLPIITLLCFAGVVVLTRNRRKGLVRAATGLALSMASDPGGHRRCSRTSTSPGSNRRSRPQAGVCRHRHCGGQPARHHPSVILVMAALVTIVALVAGNSWVRAKVGDMRKPGWVTGGPVHDFVALHRKALQWAVLALGLLVLVIWSNPTTLVAVVVTLITLALVGLVGLWAGRGRRQAVAR